MSKHETWRTRKYWESVGGLLIEEFRAIKEDKGSGTGKRHIDAIIVLGEETDRHVGGQYDFTGRDIIIVQTKGSRLGMYVMGQAFFSREIMKRFRPRSIKTVVICAAGDTEMESLCRLYDIEVVIYPDRDRPYDDTKR